jgi:hypothetical protein
MPDNLKANLKRGLKFISNCLKIIKMNNFKNCLPLFCIAAFLLVAVRGEEEEEIGNIQI